MLSGKVIKGINAGNAVFHHRTMQIIARQQTICWQWPFFLCPYVIQAYLPLQMLRCTSKGSAEANSSWAWDWWPGCAFLLGLIQTLDVGECSSGMGGLQDPSCGRSPRSAPHKRHLGGAALTEARGSDPTVSITSIVLIQKQTRRKTFLPTKAALQHPGGTGRSPLWGSAAPQLCLAHRGGGNPLPGVTHSLTATQQPHWTFPGPFQSPFHWDSSQWMS